MKSFDIKGVAVVLIVTLSLGIAGSYSRAGAGAEGRTHWGKFRLQGILTVPLGNNAVEGWNDCGPGWFDFLNFYSAINFNTSGGILASFEYVVKRRYGIELCFIHWWKIVDLHFEATDLTIDGTPNFILPTIGANYHFFTDDGKDVYAGALISLGVIATGVTFDIDISKDVAMGLNLGMDYYIKRPWSLGVSVKYIDFGQMDFSLLPPGLQGIICNNGLFGIGDLNTISMNIGMGYRF